jgi:hypothetical protein
MPAIPAPFTSSNDGARSYAVPLVVAVTGHRDLVATEIPAIEARVRECLIGLRDDYPGRLVGVMSALAEGADRLVANIALSLEMPLTVVLPMSRALYQRDFASAESRAEFDRLCLAASDIFELPLHEGASSDAVAEPGQTRSMQYAAVGVFLCAHCQVLLALWDGKYNAQLGGTGQVVRFHHDDLMPDYAPPTSVSLLSLTDDESDLVYHVVCSRDRPDGEPATGLIAGSTCWFTKDTDNPRTAQMPERHRRVFEFANEFSREAQVFAAQIDRERGSLLVGAPQASMPAGLADIDQMFCAADWLAMRYQRRVRRVRKFVHFSAGLAAIGYLSYTDLQSMPAIIMAILLLMLATMGVSLLAVRGAWHRKYLDYRTLAEGLRVQFYWAAAGVTSGSVTKFAHDNCVQMRDVELGWIRNVMRVAGTECDVAPNLQPAGLAFVLREWLGDADHGQLGYYRRRSLQRNKETARTKLLGRIGVAATLIALPALLATGTWLPADWAQPIIYATGLVLLSVAVRRSYAQRTAESELIRQYEFMHRIFRNARRRIELAADDHERRRTLKLLGDSSLEEHAEWILIHRERAIEGEEGLRLG